MHRPAARRPRHLTGLSALALLAACGDDGPPAAAPVAVVPVEAQPCDRPQPAEGVGLVVGDDLVATAAHVVDGPRREVLVDGRPGVVAAVDARSDLALVVAGVDGTAGRFTDEADGATTVVTPDRDLPVEVVRTGTLVVHDLTDHRRHERQAHTFRPGVVAGTSGAPLVDASGNVLGVVVLTNITDGTSSAATAGELQRLLDDFSAGDERHAAQPCPG